MNKRRFIIPFRIDDRLMITFEHKITKGGPVQFEKNFVSTVVYAQRIFQFFIESLLLGWSSTSLIYITASQIVKNKSVKDESVMNLSRAAM